MTIKRQLIIFTVVSLLLSFFAAGVLFFSLQNIKTIIDKSGLTNELIKSFAGLRALTYEVIIYHGDRTIDEWLNSYENIAQIIARGSVLLNDEPLFFYINRDHQRILTLFEVLKEQHDKMPQNHTTEDFSSDKNIRLSNELLTRLQALISNVFKIHQNLLVDFDKVRKVTLTSVSVAIGALVLIMIITRVFAWRRMLLPITDMAKTADLISAGNLTYRINIKRDDEIGKLANSFNIMTSKLVRAYNRLNKKVRDLQKFRMAIDNASDMVIITDPDGKILYANLAAEKITGYSRLSIVGKRPSLWGKQMPADFYKNLWERIKIKKQIFDGEVINRRKNGEKYVSREYIAPILDEQKKIQFFVSVSRDITREKEVDRAKNELISLASHQMRTPLSMVSWYTEMLLDDKRLSDKRRTEYLQKVYEGNRRMIEIVNALLNASKIELGAFAIQNKLLEIDKIMDAVLNDIAVNFPKKKIKIKRNYQKDLPVILVDKSLLEIILNNIISNAFKYNDDKGLVEVVMKNVGNKIVVTVKDNGWGIPEKAQKQVFTKLFRADNVKERDTDGTGLGLYIAKSIIDKTGGKITIKSQENKGTTVFVEYPLSGMKDKQNKNNNKRGVASLGVSRVL